MPSHVTIGTNDLARAKAVYDPLIAALGIGCIADEPERGVVRNAAGPEMAPQVYLLRPIDGRPALSGNGQTVAFVAQDRATVRAFHAAALTTGGSCKGPPGLQPHYPADNSGALVRDLEGNKIACVCHVAAG